MGIVYGDALTTSAVQLRFAAEFATFLVAVAGATILLLRPHLMGANRRVRSLLGPGFLLLAAAAFLRGSLLADSSSVPVVALQGVGATLIALGTFGWGPDTNASSRRALWGALVFTLGAEAASVLGAPLVAGLARALAAGGFGAILVTTARRSIAARFAVSVAAILLLVVLAISITLSLVINTTVQRESFKRVDARSRAEADEVIDSALVDAGNSARLAALTIQGNRAAELLALAAGGTAPDTIARDLRLLADQDLLVASGPLLYANAQRSVVVAQRVDQATADALVASAGVTPVADGRAATNATVEIVGGKALALGVQRVTARGPNGATLVGYVVATKRLDSDYLALRARSDPGVTLSLVGQDRVLGSVGNDLTQDAVVQAARRAFDGPGSATLVKGDLFLAARAVRTTDRSPPLAVISSVSGTAEGTQASLFRVLFLVALVVSLAAFVLAVAVGERIGMGLRRLTRAAQGIAQGDLGVRAGVGSNDEVGVLGDTFDFMAGSIEKLAGELRQSVAEAVGIRSRLEAVVAGMGEALLAVDRNGRITTFNGAAGELFALKPSTAVGRLVSTLNAITTEDGADLQARMIQLCAQPWNESALVHRDDGGPIPVALSGSGLTGPDGDITGGVYVLRDMRREREAERSKAQLLANISHELRTPLVPIKGYASLLLHREVAAPRAREALGAVIKAADRLEGVIDRLLEVAARDADPSPAETLLRLEPIVTAVIDRWQTRVDERHSIVATIDRDLPLVAGDADSLDRCLDELMDNAVKFSPEGGQITVAVTAISGGGVVNISVTDHGVGIPEGRLGEVFDDFAQADGSATREFGGLGLGLALVRRIVTASGGELRAITSPNEGSVLSISLPAAGYRGSAGA